eukprot:140953-Chlamydomonas_euryale.AAC.1
MMQSDPACTDPAHTVWWAGKNLRACHRPPPARSPHCPHRPHLDHVKAVAKHRPMQRRRVDLVARRRRRATHKQEVDARLAAAERRPVQRGRAVLQGRHGR